MKTPLIFRYNAEKDKKLKAERGIGFEEVIAAIEAGKQLALAPHHDRAKYPNQDIMFVELNDYVYMVPCIRESGGFFLKTIYPSRKATQFYLGKRNGGKRHA